ncbi:M13 family metallopeptidase [Asticcacaulis tiandongensis]|uniref:M13 family metallopeptidase n=1 Tax=Asticcacaulis tiandongensis TaxID=2565365 RepID=UPI00112A299D|nr:M13 family metallopeptidase [Asticcacaulis tiandongensis]
MRKSLLLVSVMSLGVAGVAQADERQCLDAHCFTQSVPAIEGLISGGEAASGTEAPSFGTWGFDLSGMDLSVAPGDDFFRYANGKAVDRIVIPDDRTSYGSFLALRNLSENRLQAIVSELAGRSDLRGDEKKIADLYASMVDVERRNALGVTPLQPSLTRIAAITDKAEMARYMGESAAFFGGSVFSPYVWDDAKNPQIYALYLFQGGLSLPDRDYYIADSFKEKLALYEVYVADVLRLIGHEAPEQAAKAIVAFETEIAQVSWSRIESRDDDKTYNPMTMAELTAYAPGFDWGGFLSGARVDKAQKIIVAQNTAFPKIAQIFADTPLETLKDWQAFKTADQAAPYLSEAVAERHWQFRSRDLSGAVAQRPLEKRGIAVAETYLGEALGQAYVARYFPAESKVQMDALVRNLKVAMGRRIDGLEWMSAATKVKAHEKLAKFGVKIGYPDKWKDYAAFEVVAGDLYGNVERGNAFGWNEHVERLDQPVDRTEWSMTPQTVNAYYSPTRNEIVFPAAILQAPFFDPEADPAVNYGAIGGVIGHEITHGFDDQGRKSDGDGHLRDWWTAEDAEKFEARAGQLAAQYGTYEPLPGAKVQGGLTIGENIADLGGILLGLEAYRLSHSEAPVLDGFTGTQRVFLGWAQVWASKYRDDALRQHVVSAPHSPPQFRVIGPMRNIDDWYKAFGVTSGTYYLKPEERVKIW